MSTPLHKKVLILSISDIAKDSRVLRHIFFIQKIYPIKVIGLGEKPSTLSTHEWIPIPQPESSKLRTYIQLVCMFLGRYFPIFYLLEARINPYLSYVAKQLTLQNDYDTILVNDYFVLPILKKYFGVKKIIFDCHEYYPDEVTGWRFNLFFKKYIYWIFRNYVNKCDAFYNVSEEIISLYKTHFSLESDLLLNIPLSDKKVYETRVHDKIKCIYHGKASQDRGIQLFIDSIKNLKSHELHLMMNGDEGYIESLKKETAGIENIIFHPACVPENIIENIAGYDLGLCLFTGTSQSLKYSLPNKFYEYILAEVPIITSTFFESMKNIIVKNEIGFVTNESDVRSFQNFLLSISKDDIAIKKSKLLYVKNEFTAEKNYISLLEKIKHLKNNVA